MFFSFVHLSFTKREFQPLWSYLFFSFTSVATVAKTIRPSKLHSEFGTTVSYSPTLISLCFTLYLLHVFSDNNDGSSLNNNEFVFKKVCVKAESLMTGSRKTFPRSISH